jgi:hypothetical protein
MEKVSEYKHCPQTMVRVASTAEDGVLYAKGKSGNTFSFHEVEFLSFHCIRIL